MSSLCVPLFCVVGITILCKKHTQTLASVLLVLLCTLPTPYTAGADYRFIQKDDSSVNTPGDLFSIKEIQCHPFTSVFCLECSPKKGCAMKV